MSETSSYDQTLGAIDDFIETTTDLTRQQLYFLQLAEKIVSPDTHLQMDTAVQSEIADNVNALVTSIRGLRQLLSQPQIVVRHPSLPATAILRGIGFNTTTANFTVDVGQETTWPLLNSAQLSLVPTDSLAATLKTRYYGHHADTVHIRGATGIG